MITNCNKVLLQAVDVVAGGDIVGEVEDLAPMGQFMRLGLTSSCLLQACLVHCTVCYILCWIDVPFLNSVF